MQVGDIVERNEMLGEVIGTRLPNSLLIHWRDEPGAWWVESHTVRVLNSAEIKARWDA